MDLERTAAYTHSSGGVLVNSSGHVARLQPAALLFDIHCQSTAIAVATLVGNLTFLPGGLGTTELSLAGLLQARGLSLEAVIGATVLVRAATLWFAVALGLMVSLLGRRRLQWDAVREEATREGKAAPDRPDETSAG